MLAWLKNLFSFGKKTPTAAAPLVSSAAPALRISNEGLEWIATHETGGKSYYESRLQRPTWPGGDSGVTIGVGYDLGYNTPAQIAADWGKHLPAGTVKRLQAVAGLKRASAQGRIAGLKDIRIPWATALQVFVESTVPRFAKMALKAFPGLDRLPVPAQEAIFSLVFNRGSSLVGASRKEMADIAKEIPKFTKAPQATLDSVAKLIQAMKRLWVGKGLDGLLKRRDSEAARVKSSLQREAQLAKSGETFRVIA